ncbi:MAG: UvrD-helicase domain-containing protein [Planctomycetales bacterium]
MGQERTTTLTPQQAAAIETRDVSIALAAGAGCGKTFVLTQRYLEELQPGRSDADLSPLVAITFTERAAREMRSRIRYACRDRLKKCADAEVEHWQKLVRQVDAARITTIHAFCAGLLRANAAEARLDPQFAVLDEATVGPMRHEASKRAVREALEERDPAAMTLVKEFGLEGAIDRCEILIGLRFQMNFEDWAEKSPEDLARFWLEKFHRDHIPSVLRSAREEDWLDRLKSLLQTEEPAGAIIGERWRILRQWFPGLESDSEAVQALKELRPHATVQGKGVKAALDSLGIYEEVRDAFAEFRSAADKLLDQLDSCEVDLPLAAEISHAGFHLARRAIERYTHEKQQAGVVDFDDLLILTRDLLRDHPDVRTKTAAGIRFLMVDEFQDTDPTQAEIVRFLLGKRLAKGKLFLVGDAQQSIYRFRRADPRVFSSLRQEIPEKGRLPLSCNFRSQPAILHFVNALFCPLRGEEFQPLLPFDEKQYSPDPSVEFLFSVAEDGNAESRRQQEGIWIARRIRELLDDPTPRIREQGAKGTVPTLRRVKSSDVVILFRAMTDVKHYEAALRGEGLDYYLVGGRAFYAQQEVYDVANMCRFLHDPSDGVSLLGILRSPFFNLSDDVLFAIWRKNSHLLEGLLSEPPQELSENQQSDVHRAGRVLRELLDLRDRSGLRELLQRALDLTGYDAALLSEFMGERKLANLQKLLEMAREFDQIGTYGLPEFVDRLQSAVVDELKEEMAATHAEGSDVIRLMSIHQSKGLEFPVVILADMDRTEPPGRAQVVFDPEFGTLLGLGERRGRKREHLALKMQAHRESRENQAEVLRLLYVAVTRAADHLLLSACLKEPDKLQSAWLKALNERFDLRTGKPRADVIPAPFRKQVPHILVHEKIPTENPADREKARLLPLREFVETVAVTEPEIWPIPDFTTQARFRSRRLSVSELEELWLGEFPIPAPQGTLAEIRAEDESLSAEEMGTLVHAVLERLDFSHPEALTSALTILQSSSRVPLNEKQKATASRLLERLIYSPVMEELKKSRRSFRELEFQLRWDVTGEVTPWTISGTIDNLVENERGEWVIYDYKTGRLAVEDENWLRNHYRLQMGIYALAVERIVGTHPRQLRLIHLRRDLPIIDYPLTETFLNGIVTEVNRVLIGAAGQP